MRNMKVFYNDGETEIYEDVQFDAFDLESIVVPMFNALIFSKGNIQISILLDTVKKIEFVITNDEE